VKVPAKPCWNSPPAARNGDAFAVEVAYAVANEICGSIWKEAASLAFFFSSARFLRSLLFTLHCLPLSDWNHPPENPSCHPNC